MDMPELLYVHSSQKVRELGHCRPCFVVQMLSMRAVILTGHQRQRDVVPLLEVREVERREAAGIYTLAKRVAYQQGPVLRF